MEAAAAEAQSSAKMKIAPAIIALPEWDLSSMSTLNKVAVVRLFVCVCVLAAVWRRCLFLILWRERQRFLRSAKARLFYRDARRGNVFVERQRVVVCSW